MPIPVRRLVTIRQIDARYGSAGVYLAATMISLGNLYASDVPHCVVVDVMHDALCAPRPWTPWHAGRVDAIVEYLEQTSAIDGTCDVPRKARN